MPLTPVPYTAGQKPTALGYFRSYELGIQELIDQLEEDSREPEKPAKPPIEPRIRLRYLLYAILIAGGALAHLIDYLLGFPRNVFSFLVPFSWIGLILVGIATRDRTPGATNFLRRHATRWSVVAVFVAFFPCAWLWNPFFSTARSPWLFAFGTALAWWAASLPDRFLRGSRRPKGPDHRLRDCREVLEAIASDVQPGKPVQGWLDLTGPEQDGKVFRRGRAASGADVQLFRDEWWRARLRLRDGNVLRISAVERVRVTAERWKQGRRRRKHKPGKRRGVATMELRLDINSAAYRTRKPNTHLPMKLGALQVNALTPDAESVSAVAECPRAEFSAKHVLSLLTLVYSALEPLPKAAAGA
jgi:hypothetical protein